MTPQRKWQEKNPKAVWAQRALRAAIRQGLVKPKPCEVCGAEPADGHHHNYSRPADVVWLCRKHHRQAHEAERRRRRDIVPELPLEVTPTATLFDDAE